MPERSPTSQRCRLVFPIRPAKRRTAAALAWLDRPRLYFQHVLRRRGRQIMMTLSSTLSCPIAPPSRAWTGPELCRQAIPSAADGHRAKPGRNMEAQFERGGRTRRGLNGKESPMCYAFSEWSWKSRAAELARKEREAAEAQKKQQSEPTPPAQPAVPETPIKERGTVPV
jgi:hypothetical protein